MKIKLRNEIDENLSLTDQLLVNRGIAREDIGTYMSLTDKVIEPFTRLNNIEKTASLLLEHIKKGSNVLIQVDSDVDGFTSASLFYNYVKANYPDANLFYQVHDQKRHGLDMVDDIYQEKYQLIVVPDAGSNEFDKHKELHELGIDVIVLDHHEAPHESEHAVVVNNQLSEDYDNKELSGVGVVWQFCRAIDYLESFKDKPMVRDAGSYLDLVALGLVADMMDLRSFETRRLVTKGLEMMNDPHNPHANKLVAEIIDRQSYSLGNEVTPIGIAFYIAPMINATVRVGTHEERVAVFESFLDEKADDALPSTKRGAKEGDIEIRTEQSVRFMTNIRNRQKREEEKGVASFGGHIDQEYLDNNSLIILDTKGEVVKDLNGLIANQMQSKYKRPALVLREKDGFIEGSGRGHETDIMKDFRQFINDSGYAVFAEGHPNAFGVKFEKDKFEEFVKYTNEELDYGNAHKEYLVDFIFEADEIDQDAILEMSELQGLWGTNMEEPSIMFKNVEVKTTDKTMMRSNTMKIMAEGVPCIKFRASDELFEKIAPNDFTISVVNIIGRPNLNEYNGNRTGQLFIEDVQIVDKKINF